MTSVSKYVFIYGTFKSGQPNYHLMKDIMTRNLMHYITKGSLKDNRPLVIASEFNLPYILEVAGIGRNVKGEIYMIDCDKALEELDSLENHPDFYERKICTVIDTNNKSEIDCWTYLLTDFPPELLEYQYLEEYYDGILGKYYVDITTKLENYTIFMKSVKQRKKSIRN